MGEGQDACESGHCGVYRPASLVGRSVLPTPCKTFHALHVPMQVCKPMWVQPVAANTEGGGPRPAWQFQLGGMANAGGSNSMAAEEEGLDVLRRAAGSTTSLPDLMMTAARPGSGLGLGVVAARGSASGGVPVWLQKQDTCETWSMPSVGGMADSMESMLEGCAPGSGDGLRWGSATGAGTSFTSGVVDMTVLAAALASGGGGGGVAAGAADVCQEGASSSGPFLRPNCSSRALNRSGTTGVAAIDALVAAQSPSCNLAAADSAAKAWGCASGTAPAGLGPAASAAPPPGPVERQDPGEQADTPPMSMFDVLDQGLKRALKAKEGLQPGVRGFARHVSEPGFALPTRALARQVSDAAGFAAVEEEASSAAGPTLTILEKLSSAIAVVGTPGPGCTLVWNGLRVRMGMASGAELQDIRFNAALGESAAVAVDAPMSLCICMGPVLACTCGDWRWGCMSIK